MCINQIGQFRHVFQQEECQYQLYFELDCS